MTDGEVGMRLIDAYTLQDAIHKSKMENPHKDAKVAKNHEFEHEHFMRMVVLQPTVMKEIVRCKDCNRRGTYDCPIYVGGNGDHGSPDDWFCADGEKEVKWK